MRVVAGKYRAKKLKEFDISSTRPTLDRVKEAIFSAIQFDVLGAKVLDLFAGTGALGIEAISRGAKLVHFVDKDARAIKLIKENTKDFKEDFKIFNTDFESYLLGCGEKFDIVLLDPPFKTDFGEKAIEMIVERDLLNSEGIIVYEKSKEKVFDKMFDDFDTKEKTYGTVEVVFLRKKNEIRDR